MVLYGTLLYGTVWYGMVHYSAVAVTSSCDSTSPDTPGLMGVKPHTLYTTRQHQGPQGEVDIAL